MLHQYSVNELQYIVNVLLTISLSHHLDISSPIPISISPISLSLFFLLFSFPFLYPSLSFFVPSQSFINFYILSFEFLSHSLIRIPLSFPIFTILQPLSSRYRIYFSRSFMLFHVIVYVHKFILQNHSFDFLPPAAFFVFLKS